MVNVAQSYYQGQIKCTCGSQLSIVRKHIYVYGAFTVFNRDEDKHLMQFYYDGNLVKSMKLLERICIVLLQLHHQQK